MKKQIIAVFVGKFIAMLCAFIIPVILTRTVSKSDYGTYQIFYTVLIFSVSFFSLGIHSNLYYFYPKAKTKKDKKRTISTTFFVFMLISLLTFLFLLVPPVKEIFIGELKNKDMQSILVFCIVLLLPTNLIDSLIVVKKNTLLNFIYPLIDNIFRVILVIGFYFWTNNISAFAYGFLAYAILKILTTILLVSNDLSWRDIQYRNLKDQLNYGIPFGIAVSLKTLTQRLDKLVLINTVSASAYATYSVAFFGIPGISVLFDSFSKVIVLKLSEYMDLDQFKEAHFLFKKLIEKTSSITIPLITIVLYQSEDIISLVFTDKYLDATIFFRIYLATIILLMLCPGIVLRAAGKTKFTLQAYFYSALITIPITLISIRLFALYGAIGSAVLSLLLPTILILNYERKILNTGIKEFLPIKSFIIYLLISIAAIIPISILQFSISNSLVKILSISFIYLSVVFIIQIKLNIFIIDDFYKTAKSFIIRELYTK